MSQFRAKRSEVESAVRWVEGRHHEYSFHHVGNDDVARFLGVNFGSINGDVLTVQQAGRTWAVVRGSWLLRRADGDLHALSNEEFLEKYAEVGFAEEAAPPAELNGDQVRDLAEAAFDALMDHPDFARWWAESAAADRRLTRQRMRKAMKEVTA